MIVVNCLLIPAAAWGIFKVSGIKDAYVSGATLAAVGAAGAMGLKAAQLAKRADLPLAVSAVIVLQLLNPGGRAAVVLVSLTAGYFAGGRNAPARASTGLVTGVRFTALGLIIIGTQLHANPDYLGPAIVFALVDMIVAMIVALEMGRRTRASAPGKPPAASGDGGGADSPGNDRPATPRAPAGRK